MTGPIGYVPHLRDKLTTYRGRIFLAARHRTVDRESRGRAVIERWTFHGGRLQDVRLPQTAPQPSRFISERTIIPHQFRTRNNLIETQRTRSRSNKNVAKSTNPTDILPLLTVWLQVRVLPGPPKKSIVYGLNWPSGITAPDTCAFRSARSRMLRVSAIFCQTRLHLRDCLVLPFHWVRCRRDTARTLWID